MEITGTATKPNKSHMKKRWRVQRVRGWCRYFMSVSVIWGMSFDCPTFHSPSHYIMEQIMFMLRIRDNHVTILHPPCNLWDMLSFFTLKRTIKHRVMRYVTQTVIYSFICNLEHLCPWESMTISHVDCYI